MTRLFRRASAVAAVGACCCGWSACAPEAAARPQLVVVVDTDTALVGQLGDGDLSPALAIDTVRIDLVTDGREVADYRDFTAPDARDWPLSFGVATTAGTSRVVRLRVRAFRASLATRGELGELTTIEPPTNMLIDRIVEVDQPSRDVRTVRVVLSAACFGAPASFQVPFRTCVDAARRDAAPTEGVLEGSAPTLVGTALEAREQACAATPKKGAVCVLGGPTVLGDARLSNVVAGPPNLPVRPALLTPFHMDRTEMTVGRYRKLLLAGEVTEEPLRADPSDSLRRYCSWLGPNDAKNDKLPLNCVTFDLAAKACATGGGTLPTEAQWEHAARGRGRSFLFPWGDAAPKCCSASTARDSNLIDGECGGGEGLEPVASHANKGCSPEDVSIDGVVDLGGSLKEMLLDGGVSYADPCWSGPGLVLDPKCSLPDLAAGRSTRGSDWSAGTGLLRSAFRFVSGNQTNVLGFRCVYPDR
ncbi:MAG: SUMF1/EgtB/PvdO family nonheme iron enzyme [Labilithrix sp.]|nr:SUMF1/EgtB/PvdO family nonheme iron enzyme [Labilithrix sp.]